MSWLISFRNSTYAARRSCRAILSGGYLVVRACHTRWQQLRKIQRSTFKNRNRTSQKTHVFLDVTPCSQVEVKGRFEETCRWKSKSNRQATSRILLGSITFLGSCCKLTRLHDVNRRLYSFSRRIENFKYLTMFQTLKVSFLVRPVRNWNSLH
jgi:hypothetical protein